MEKDTFELEVVEDQCHLEALLEKEGVIVDAC